MIGMTAVPNGDSAQSDVAAGRLGPWCQTNGILLVRVYHGQTVSAAWRAASALFQQLVTTSHLAHADELGLRYRGGHRDLFAIYSLVHGTTLFHRPHPGNEIYPSDLKRIRRFLTETGAVEQKQ